MKRTRRRARSRRWRKRSTGRKNVGRKPLVARVGAVPRAERLKLSRPKKKVRVATCSPSPLVHYELRAVRVASKTEEFPYSMFFQDLPSGGVTTAAPKMMLLWPRVERVKRRRILFS